MVCYLGVLVDKGVLDSEGVKKVLNSCSYSGYSSRGIEEIKLVSVESEED